LVESLHTHWTVVELNVEPVGHRHALPPVVGAPGGHATHGVRLSPLVE
jgi:hypothetical protein